MKKDTTAPDALGDLHMQLSNKYMAYKDLAERCLLNPNQLDKGDRRVFYFKPNTPFLQEPREQNRFRTAFLDGTTRPPNPEPLTLVADDLHKAYIERTMDRSHPTATKQELANYFKRRQYKLQHKKHKLLLRWAHHCLTTEMVDRVSLKFSPAYSKIQFELENCVKRFGRLDGDDHFESPKRATAEERSSYANVKDKPPLSALRADDIDVYLRCITYDEKITRWVEKVLSKAKWLPLTHRFEVHSAAIEEFQNIKNNSIKEQELLRAAVEDKCKLLIEVKKLGDRGVKEMTQILQASHISKFESKVKNARDKIMQTAKYNYEMPPLAVSNEPEMKLELARMAKIFGITGNQEIDSGHPFSYNVMVYFPQKFQEQSIKNMFAPYEANPVKVEMDNQPIKNVLKRNQKRYGRPSEASSQLLESQASVQPPAKHSSEFVNSIESSLFGEFNNGQATDFPAIRLKKSDWIEFICFQPFVDGEQKYQASVLGSEKNWIDECLAYLMEILNVQDVPNANLMLDSLAQIHSDKLKYGSVKTDALTFQLEEADTFFTEDQKQFLSLFKGCFKAKADYDAHKTAENLPTSSLHEIPQHLLFAKYLVECLNARENKTKLLHILNAFRAIQRRLALELREMGTRDRVLGEAELIRPMEGRGQEKEEEDGKPGKEGATARTARSSVKQEPEIRDAEETVDVINDALIDINKYRYNDRMCNYMYSTCPIVPKFHATFGQPIERQEISAEIDMTRHTDIKQGEGQKLLGRVDKIYLHKQSQLYLVQDDFGVHVLYDSVFPDMRSLETEILKTCSFYINKAEPLLDNDLKNIYPAVDRLKMLEQALDYERQYQEEKFILVSAQLECFEHASDILEQQRLVQAIADEMAKRPRFNLSGVHFKDSYVAEIQCLREKTKLIRQLMKNLIKNEFHENTLIREYREKTYRLLHEQMENKWSYAKPEKLEGELNKRELIQTGTAGTRDAKVDAQLTAEGKPVEKTEGQVKALEEKVQREASNIFSTKFGDPKEFANYLGMPYSSLQMLMKDHHERDPSVRQAIHEHVSFIKIQEGYPQFLYPCAQVQNQVRFAEQSESIGLLDFYESLAVMPRVLSCIQRAFTELAEVHRPDNGLLMACLELSCIKSFTTLVQTTLSEDGKYTQRAKGTEYIEDDEILGTSDKMLFYTKELASSAEDEGAAHNPFVVGKLDMASLKNFNFDNFQGYIGNPIEKDGLGGEAKDQAEAARRMKVDKKNFGRFFPKLHEHNALITVPSMLILSCNTVEILRLRNTLIMTLQQALVLEELFLKQTKCMGKEGLVYLKDKFKFPEYLVGVDETFVNFIDDGPASDLQLKLAINEFDPSLRSALNFADPECFKALILPLGLEELRAVVQYEVMNLQALIVATQTNQIQLDNAQRKLCEIGFLERGFTVANPVFNVFEKLQGKNLFESNLRKLPGAERSAVNSYIIADIGDGHFNIVSRKTQMRTHVEKLFQTMRGSIVNDLKEARAMDPLECSPDEIGEQKLEVALRRLRTARLILCHDYCRDILANICCDSIKLQLLLETDRLRKRAYLLPRDSMVLELFQPGSGEHQFAAYNEELKEGVHRDQTLFQSKGDNRIQSFWRLPPNREVTSIALDMIAFRKKNMPGALKIEPTDPAQQSGPSSEDSFDCLTKIRKRLPSLTLIDSRDAESVTRERSRLVDFAEAFDYDPAGKALKLLSYFKSLSNLLDLEFFTNKLASSAFTIANVEKMVLAGVPFWEEGDEALFADLDDEDEDSHPEADANRFEEGGHRPLKNVLATRVAERMASEKREKMQLLQDLEAVKDRFVAYESIMHKQEMSTSLARAATFLNDIHHINFYSVLFILQQMQDSYFKEQKGQKEVQFINELIQTLSHQQDLKMTYSNGFHVNRAVTALDRLDLEAGCYNQEYDSFFKATQPIIDEEALNPPEYNLVAGIYLVNSINLITFKKNPSYMGALMARDYTCLDFALTNLSKEVRKYAASNFASVEDTLRNFLKAKSNTEEEDFQSNPAIYSEILQEKKRFLKLQIKARQSKRVLMMIMSKRAIPMDIDEYNKIASEYQDRIQWKVVDQIDKIAQARVEQASPVKRRKGNTADQVMVSNLNPTRQQHLKAFDQATSEIDVVHAELQKFMMQTALDMFKRETDALTKAFEMGNLPIQAFIHPVQQYASTLDQHIDSRHHLDIVNKVEPMQKMLTQIKNRSLEIQTLTSGAGVVISSKDLNECLAECCRALVKYGEIEMRTRCEYLAMMVAHLQQLLYVKDQQLLSLDHKLQTAKAELNRIVSTKVFSQGNNLVYELDIANRQLRLLKDNIFQLESNLTEKIRLCYDRELDQARMQLADFRKQFFEYQESVSAQIKAGVREEVNSIEGVMKAKADKYKELGVKTAQQKLREEAEARQKALLEKQAAQRPYRTNNAVRNTINIENLVIQKNQPPAAGSAWPDAKQRAELESLKANEKEARHEVLALQDIIRKQRYMNKFKEVLVTERHQFKIDNLKQQLTSNTTLWEQLAESKQREKVLQGEIDRAQQEIATQEKVCERLRDELKKERREKQKLLDYKSTKSKRLDELETQAREFEVLSSVNLTQILSMLEQKDRKLRELQGTEQGHSDFIESMVKLQEGEMKSIKYQARIETKAKLEAIGKLENLRHEVQAIKGGEQVSAAFWKEQSQHLFQMCKHLQDQNERLTDGVGGTGHNVSFNDPDFLAHSTPGERNDGYQKLNATPSGFQKSQGSQSKKSMSSHTQLQQSYGRGVTDFQDHLLTSTNSIDGTRNAANGLLSSVMAGASSKHSILSEVKDLMKRPRQVQLPLIGAGNSRNVHPSGSGIGGGAQTFEPAGVRASRGPPLKTMKPGTQTHNLARELGNLSSSVQAKMTPMQAKLRAAQAPNQHPVSVGDLHSTALKANTKGANVFSSLQKTSLHNISSIIPSSSFEAAQHHTSQDQLTHDPTERTVLNQPQGSETTAQSKVIMPQNK